MPQMAELYVVKTDSPSGGKGVLVTEDWDEAAGYIKDVVDAGHAVRVEPAERHG